MSAVTATQSDFQLQFAPAEIPVLARRYVEGGSEEDEKAFAAGTQEQIPAPKDREAFLNTLKRR